MDCYHIIINGLILLIFLHILLSNIDFHQVIGKPKEQTVEKFGRQLGMPDNEREERQKSEYQKSIQFLQDGNDLSSVKSDDDFKSKLLSFIRKSDTPKESVEDAQQQFVKKNIPPVMASNTFTSNLNVPNFESNVLNVQKFYTINSPDSSSSVENFDNMDAKTLKTNIRKLTSDEFTNEQSRDGMVLKQTPIPNLSNDVNDSKSSFGRVATELPPVWEYKNELPMNGGTIGGGIVGFDALESQFSMYSSGSMQMQPANSPNFQIIPHDDLRKPIKYEN